MKRLTIYLFLLFFVSLNVNSQVTVSGAHPLTNGTFTTLGGAFTAINNQTQTGNSIIITITGSSIESSTAVLNSGSWNSLLLYPVISGLSISGNLTAPLIDLNGADNVTIDGRVNAAGNVTDLTLANTSTSATATTSTIRFINDASNNTVRYCNIRGASQGGANFLFSTTAGSTGNDNNIIDNNNITNVSDANRPAAAIYSSGTPSLHNNGNIISNNNIFDIFNRSIASNAINISSNNTAWTITANSIYESSSFTPLASVPYNAIVINSTAGSGFTVSDNYIGGSSALCAGAPWTKSNAWNNVFNGIYIIAGTGTSSSIQNNTIKNFNWGNSLNANWTGISAAGGDINIGTVTGNTIGDITGTGSITVVNSTSGSNLFGISILSPGINDCRNNKIGSITTSNDPANASDINAIFIASTAGNTTVNNNTIGSGSASNSILASSTSIGKVQNVRGIYNLSAATVQISGNVVANLTNGSNNNITDYIRGEVNGICSENGTITISNNTINNLSSSNNYGYANNSASVCGISAYGVLPQTITNNTIYNLSNSYGSFTGSVVGIYLSGRTGNVVSSNFIHSLSVSNGSNASLHGINIGTGSSEFYNNIISLGGNTPTTIYGIYQSGAAGYTCRIYFNTVYIGGTPVSGSNRSYSLYSTGTANTRDYRNNILVNTRSTAGGSNQHFALYLVQQGGTLTCDYNDYLVSGSGSILGYYGGLRPALPIINGQDAFSVNRNPLFSSPGGIINTDYVPSDLALYASTGIGVLTDYAGTPRSISDPTIGAYEIVLTPLVKNIEVYKGPTLEAEYTTLNSAFDAFNAGTHNTGSFQIRIKGSITENLTAVINASGTGAANYTSILIFPLIPGISISGNLTAPLIDLNGADNVTIDGRVNAAGNVTDLTLANTSTSATATTSTIRFINDASNNTVRYCNIRGASQGGANFLFSTTAGSTGNDNNIIDNNNITNVSDANRPAAAIYSSGTPSLHNNGNIISNNNIFDIFNRSITSNAINISSNNTAWTITANSIYESSSFTPLASVPYNAIVINSTAGSGFTVSDNYIGGSSALCAGAPWTKSNAWNNVFNGIYIIAGTGTSSSIQNNTIKNFNWGNSLNANWTGISAAGGDINIGTVTGNTIGDITGTGSITVVNSTSGSNLFGISILSPGINDCRNNKIGSITTSNDPANASDINAIFIASTAGNTTVNNNTIGSGSASNSILASSTSIGKVQNVRGIYNLSAATVQISGNVVANLTNGSNNNITDYIRGEVNGICSENGTITISNNTINNLSSSNNYGYANNSASVCGISAYGVLPQTITNNTIYNLSNSYGSFTGSVVGIYLSGRTGNVVSSNFIHSLSVSNGSNASLHGINIGTGSSEFYNNIISLGGNTPTTIYGIYQSGAAGYTCRIYFNTVYIGGTPVSGSNRSYSLYSTGTANTRDYRNNILVNTRSTAGGSNQHFALYLVQQGGTLTCDYNDYLVSGSGSILGYYGGLRPALPIVTGQDVNSFSINPIFSTPGGALADDYKIEEDLIGVSGTGITTDYSSAARNNPTMGAWERVANKWTGTISTDFATAGNWTGNSVPIGSNPNIIFDDLPINHCYLDGDRAFNNITNGQSTYRLVANGHKLTIRGNLIFTNGAQIDASLSGSAVEYAGSAAQTIESGQYLDAKVSDLIINNAAGITLNCDFTVDNSLTINTGGLFTISPMRLLTVSGALTNNAGIIGLVIKSDATGDGKLINNTPDIPATVELYLSGGIISPTVGIYHYIVPPVESMSIGTVPTIDEVKTALGITNFTGNILRFNEPATVTSQNQGWQYFDNYPGVPPGFTSITSARGYNINLRPNADVLKFKGEMNAGQHTFNISYTTGNYGAGWNLVGNPYPSDYDLNGIAGLGTVVDGMSNTIYYNNNGTYGYWNVLTNTGSSAGYTDVLPPMTGFYVVATNSNFLNLVLPVSSKSIVAGDTRTQHKGSSIPELDEKEQSVLTKVKLILSKESMRDETIVILADDAKISYNEHYDAFKLFNTNSTAPGIYSNLNGVDYFMKAVVGPVSTPVRIPLKIMIKEGGTHEINIKEFENLNDIPVALIHGDKKTILNKNSIYSFTSGVGTFTDFALVFGESGAEITKDLNVNGSIKTWYRDQYLYINSASEDFSGNCNLQIFDVQGRPVFNDKDVYLVSGQTHQLQVVLSKGIYILSINSNYRSSKLKFVVF